MNNTIIQEAIANIASTSLAIERYANDPDNRCSPDAAILLERMSWQLQKQANDLEEINYLYVS